LSFTGAGRKVRAFFVGGRLKTHGISVLPSSQRKLGSILILILLTKIKVDPSFRWDDEAGSSLIVFLFIRGPGTKALS